MSDDPFETVAIAYSQPQAGVILSMFAWYGIPAFARNIEHIRVNPNFTLALGGIPIQVHPDFAGEARALLTEAAERDSEARRQTAGERIGRGIVGTIMAMAAVAGSPRISAEIVERR